MKPFRFSLQALLTLRQRQEKQALEDYGRVISLREAAINRLQVAEKKCEVSRALRQEQVNAGAPAVFIAQLQDYSTWAEDYRRDAQHQLECVARVVNEHWQKLLHARQEREAVETYMLRQRERYDRELQREEQKLLDDMARRRRPAPSPQPNPELTLN